MLVTLFIVVALSCFLGAMLGRRLSAGDRKHINIALLQGLNDAQKGLYLLTMLAELEARVKELDKKNRTEHPDLLAQIEMTTKQLQKMAHGNS